jgi:hypothetical protein
MLSILKLAESMPEDPSIWPRCGTISADRVGAMGKGYEAFLYQASNRHYDAYFDTSLNELADGWAGLTAQRHQRITDQGAQVLSVFVPNKATCLPAAFPQPMPRGGTTIWKRLTHLLADDSGVIFSLQKMKIDESTMSGAWLRTDSHWSRTGCLLSVNEILKQMGFPILNLEIDSNFVKVSGDLASRWRGQVLVELRKDLVSPEIVTTIPELDFDNYQGGLGHLGRHVRWANKDAKYQINVTIVGNSFSGTGRGPGELTWWLARLFKSVTFLHSSLIPTDVVEMTSCDVLIFQTVERFLYVLPQDNLTCDEIVKFLADQS